MELTVFRHGIAEREGPDGSDGSRRLTDDGVAKTTQAARGLAALIDCPDVILTSPLVRARQTADILGRVFDTQPQVLDALAHGPAEAVVRQLRRRREGRVMIVGHEPTLSRVVEKLCAATEGMGFIKLKKAGCAFVQSGINAGGAPGQDELVWLATPKMLRQLAGK